MKQIIIDQLHVKNSQYIADKLYDCLYEDDSQIFKNMLNEEELDVIEQVYFRDKGIHVLQKEFEGETEEEQNE